MEETKDNGALGVEESKNSDEQTAQVPDTNSASIAGKEELEVKEEDDPIEKAKEMLDSALGKVVSFIQSDQTNAVALSGIFIKKQRAGTGGAAGVPIDELMEVFGDLGIGLTSEEGRCLHGHFDTDKNGKLSLQEFTAVIAAANGRLRAAQAPIA